MRLFRTVFLLPLGCLIIAGCATQTGSQAGSSRSLETFIADEANEIQAVQSIFNNDELWSNSDIEVVSFNRTLLLIGQTPTLSLKQRAEQLVSSIPGIKKIYNEIRVAAPTGSLSYLNDLALTSKVKAALFSKSNLDASKVKVVTEDSEVFLLGLVTQAEAQSAIETARNVSGVKRVIQAFEIIGNPR
jgi:osmotically-inducible protein OsmY